MGMYDPIGGDYWFILTSYFPTNLAPTVDATVGGLYSMQHKRLNQSTRRTVGPHMVSIPRISEKLDCCSFERVNMSVNATTPLKIVTFGGSQGSTVPEFPREHPVLI